METLLALEDAYERLVVTMGLPAPEWDGGLGGTVGLDFYLTPASASGPRAELEVAFDPPDPWGFDRASTFCTAPVAPGSERLRSVALCVAEAIAARLDPALTPSLRRAYASHLWHAIGAPTKRDLEELEDAQVSPERAVVGHARSAGTAGATLLFEHLELTRGRGGGGALATALLAAAASDTPPRAIEWDDEPDLLDVLRHTLGERPAEMGRLFGQFAVARAFLGSRDDGTHFPRLLSIGDGGKVRFDWALPLSTLPRRVAATHPVEPTGSVYVWIALDEVLLTDRLGFQAEWEPPVAFQWTLVRVGPDGRELSRVLAPYQERATAVTQQLEGLASAAAVLIVGTNLGGVDLEHPHDPDLWPVEPSGCTVYVTPL
ncbi:MAG: hypothetical protein JW751_23110 [Polyangiaceae bacterium]|nr:hypothetical protein [Polyangiaceae bacterium]